jgi:serine protease
MSLGGSSYSVAEEEAFERIYNSGVIVIAYAGNYGSTSCSYPASYSSVISVGAINIEKNHASFSQQNSQVDLVAPGVDIVSTRSRGGTIDFSCTSMAAPHVEGVAVLIWSHYPNESAQAVRMSLEILAEDLGPPGRDDEYGYGLVNAKEALDLLSKGCFPTCTNSPLN